MKKIFAVICLLFLLMAMPGFAGDAHVSKTGTLYLDKSKSYNGYHLFTSLASTSPELGATYLIDLDGNVVHKWLMQEDHNISLHAYLLPNGNLLRGITPHHVAGGKIPAMAVVGIEYAGTKYQEVDWNGNVLWEVRHPNHRDITVAEFQQITGLTDAQMNDPAAVTAAAGAGGLVPTANQIKMMTKYDRSEHHDFKKIYNKKLGKETLLFVNMRYVPAQDVQKLGVNTTVVQRPTAAAVSMDCVSEVDIQTGELVWDWCFQDHLIQNFSSTAQNYSVDIANQSYNGDIEEAFYRRMDVNVKTNQGSVGPHADWTHVNSFDYNADRDEVVVNSRQHSEFYVIDHNTTTAEAKGKKGDFLYRFGSPYNYASDYQLGTGLGKAKSPSFQSAEYTQIWGAHNIHWIPNGRPGAGHFLIFDNGSGRVGNTYSAILEINGLDTSGKYVKELTSGYGASSYPSGPTGFGQLFNMAGQTMMKVSKQIVWGYSAMPHSLSSPYISGCERLANGNTQVTSGMYGHMFEVTPTGNLAWEYVSPIMAGNYVSETLGFDASGMPFVGGAPYTQNSVFRSHRYAADYPGLAGRELRSQGTITSPATYTGFGFGATGITFGGGSSGGSSGGSGGGGY
jgi:hypothetical protein